MAGQTAGPIKTKLGIGTHVDPGSVLVKVKVKVERDRGPQGRDNSLLLPEDAYLQLVILLLKMYKTKVYNTIFNSYVTHRKLQKPQSVKIPDAHRL